MSKLGRDPMSRVRIHSMAAWVLGCRTWVYLKSCWNALEFTNLILQYHVASSIKAWYFSWKTDILKWLMSRMLMGCWMRTEWHRSWDSTHWELDVKVPLASLLTLWLSQPLSIGLLAYTMERVKEGLILLVTSLWGLNLRGWVPGG